MRAIQAADDELDDEGGKDLELVHSLVERCMQRCAEALKLLPSLHGA